MKLAVTGKGGVGKTTVAAALARYWHDQGQRVVAVDADPDANLAWTLGYRGQEIAPLTSWKTLIQERVGGEGWGGFLKLNPRVEDIPGRVGVEVDGIRVLVMGTIERGRRGCACPENVLVREVLNHLFLEQDQRVVVDMEAGVEHLGRGTAEGVDMLVVVVEPGWAALQTAGRVAKLAADLQVGGVCAVANKVAEEGGREFVREHMPPGLDLLDVLPFDRNLEEQARRGTVDSAGDFYQRMAHVAQALERRVRP